MMNTLIIHFFTDVKLRFQPASQLVRKSEFYCQLNDFCSWEKRNFKKRHMGTYFVVV